MAVTDENMVMPVAPMGYNNGNGFGNGFGGDGWWIILLFILLGNGGWGGFGGGWGMNGMLGYDFPWLLNGQNGINNNVNDGFRTAQLSDSVTSVRDGVSNLATQLCGCCGDIQMSIAGTNQNIASGTAAIQNSLCQGFAGTTAAVTGAQNAVTQQLYTNQLADLERSFAAQTASTAGMNNIQAQLAQCCCDNRLATESLRATVLSENCEDRNQALLNTRDIITNATGNTQAMLNAINSGIQSIKDDLCADRLDAERRENANLRTQLNMANLAASQTAQTARLLSDNAAQTQALEQYLNPVPIPAYIVQNPNCCTQNGCGCGGNF